MFDPLVLDDSSMLAARASALGSSRPQRPSGWIAQLSLHQFRCHEKLDLETSAAPVIIIGGNGVGKTSCLEALSCFAAGKSMRQTPARELARLEGDGAWSVSALLNLASGAQTRLGVGMTPDAKRRQMRIGGKAARKSADFAALIRPLWLTPSMERLLERGQQTARRSFLDRLALALDPAHGTWALRLKRSATHYRQCLLQAYKDPVWLASIERELAHHALALTRSRVKQMQTINELLVSMAAPVKIAFTSPLAQVAAEPEGEAKLARLLARGRKSGHQSAFLPRSKIGFTHQSGRDSSLCSTGERKLMLAVIMLAAARAIKRTGVPPLLLLDDIAAFLDARLRQRLFRACMRLGVQFWATGTKSDEFAALGTQARYITLPPAIR